MKKITDSLLKRIVRQSLNESYNVLNESYTIGPITYNKNTYETIKIDFNPCVDGGFCLGGKGSSIWSAKNKEPKLSGIKEYGKTVIELAKNCNLKMGKPKGNVSQIVDNLIDQFNKANTDENKVKKIISNLDFPTWCATIKRGAEIGYDNIYSASVADVGSEDYVDTIEKPSLSTLRKSISITEEKNGEFWKSIADSLKNSKTKQDELLVTAKKCGYDTIDEYKKANWKCLGPKIIVGGGGANTVNIAQFAPCVVEHPALETENGKPKEYSLPNGAGYKLKTGVPVIDDYIFGVVLVDDNRQEPKKMSTLKQIPIAFDCETDKFIKWSFSNNAWTYNGVFESDGKVALTTDPSRNNDFLSESKRTKGFRYNLLTEASKVTTTTTTVATQVNPAFEELSLSKKSKGQQVVDIQTKLGISTKGGFGPQTEKAVKDFQTKYSDKAPTVLGVSDPLRTDGIVDENTYKLIMKFKGASSPKEYGGVIQNYIANNWVKVNPVPGNEDTKLGLNDGIFKIAQKLNEYTIVIDCEWDDTIKGGGTTQKLLFGDSSSEGSKTIIKKGDKAAQGDQSIEGGGNVSKGNTNTEVSAEDAEKVRKRKLRNQESCKVMREIKQYLNNTKGLDLPLNCKFTTETKNQVMMALTGGSPAPIQEPGVNVQPVPVTDKLF
jgi:peptidoglycan hydrolase-like protein with peptidoglycan-binding domain